MPRIALGVEYDGSRYHGWQAQDSGVPTIQAEVEKALSRVANHPVQVLCAGRTDKGVHASGQVVHFDSDAPRDMHSWVMGANTNLPREIGIRWAQPVADDFHARYRAFNRCYRYVIFNSRVRPALFSHQVSWCYRPLDIDAMRQAAASLLGTHDFSAFRGVQCQAKTPVKTLERLDLRRQGRLIILEARADAFLMHMVRNIAGVLMAIGAGEASPAWARQVLDGRDRTLGGVTAPPGGLYLVAIGYPEQYRIPTPPPGPLWLEDD